MNKDWFCLSSSGLKNINKEDKNFLFIFGDREIRMNNILAEFFSPIVSRLHLSDPTISSFIFDYPPDVKSKLPKFDELLSDDIQQLIQNLSSGSKVKINEEQKDKLLIISVLIDNEELFGELFKLYPIDVNQSNIDHLLNQIQLIEKLSLLNKIKDFNLPALIDKISSNLYAIDENKLKKLSKPILFSIISNSKLKIKSEDWLFDFIQSIHEDEDNEYDYDMDFYEQICISCLSEDKFKELLLSIKPSEMTSTFWEHICFRICDPKSKGNIINNRYNKCSGCIVVGGFDKYNQLNEKPNNKDKDEQLISPPVKLSFDSSLYQSYSIYAWHSVEVTSGGSLLGVGYNNDGRISASLTKTEISDFTEFCVRDSNGLQLNPVSVVCCSRCTLYMFTKSGGNGSQLVLCDKEINDGKEIFLDIGNQEPVALFGGRLHAAAINTKGEVIFINRDSIKNFPSSPIASSPLPDDEKASSVAFCNNSVVVLSSNGRVFSSVIEEGSNSLSFSAVAELSGKEIVCLSGVHEHCLCVSSDGKVFGRGSNSRGRLGLGEGTGSVSSFTEISSLSGYEIIAAYAGGLHSLFETREGKIISCGCNDCGQLLLSSGAGDDVYSPKETTITSCATFCIAGHGLSVVFIGSEPPPNTPNRRIQQH